MFIYPKECKEHMRWAEKEGLCEQCICPWFDGICSCEGYKKFPYRMNDAATAFHHAHHIYWKKHHAKVAKRDAKARAKAIAKLTPKFQEKLNKAMLSDNDYDLEKEKKKPQGWKRKF